ncbi:6074_t:CDS:2 [Entrophospora sp. SA101]|nr:6074_t:CDS:2 [Entrophospora sp. SA101]
MQSKNKSPFPLSKLPFDILENITSIIIKHERFKVIGSNIIFINRTFAKAAIPQVWKTIYIYEANEREDKVINKLTRILFKRKGLKELILDSNHSSFNDLLLKKISRKKSFIKDIKRLSLNGTNFTNKGIINYIIPLLKDDNYNKTSNLTEVTIGYDGIYPCANITSKSIIHLLLDSAEITNSPLQMLPKSTIECLFLGKINQQTFTSKGLRSLLLLCHENLLSLVIDLDHITSSSTSSSSLSPSYVLKDIIIPIFQNQKLQEIHLISDSWSEWNDFYPKPRSEHELKAKEALWRWTLKSYWGISNNLIESLSKSIKTLKIFTILDDIGLVPSVNTYSIVNTTTNQTVYNDITIKADFDSTSSIDNPFSNFFSSIPAAYFWINGNWINRDTYGSYFAVQVLSLIASLLILQATFISDYEVLNLGDNFLNSSKPDPKYICYNNNNLDSWKERTKSRRGCLYAKYENENSYIQYILEKKDFDHQAVFDSVGGRSSNNRDKIGKPPSKFKGGSFQVKIPNSSD